MFFLGFRIWNLFADFSLFNLYVMFISWSSSYFYFLSSLLPTCYPIFITTYLVIIFYFVIIFFSPTFTIVLVNHSLWDSLHTLSGLSVLFSFSSSIMSFSELTTHPNRYTNSFNTTQTTQILYPQHRKKSNRNNANNLC